MPASPIALKNSLPEPDLNPVRRESTARQASRGTVAYLERSVSIDFVRLLRNWYSRLTASVMWNNFVCAHFVILCSVRQGGILSPLLFSVYVDDLIRLLKHSVYGTYIHR